MVEKSPETKVDKRYPSPKIIETKTPFSVAAINTH